MTLCIVFKQGQKLLTRWPSRTGAHTSLQEA